MVCYDRTIFENLESEGAKNQNIEKITFKVVQMKFLAMHITNQKWSFDIFTEGKCTKYLHGTWSLLNILMILGIKEKRIILSHSMNVGYCYKYTCVTDDCFCAAGTHIRGWFFCTHFLNFRFIVTGSITQSVILHHVHQKLHQRWQTGLDGTLC